MPFAEVAGDGSGSKDHIGGTSVKTLAAALSLAAVAAAAAIAKAPAAPPYVAAAIADPGRGKDVGMDDQRKPAAIVAFSHVKPGDKVADLIPGHGYWAEIFSPLVGSRGRVYEIWPEEYARLDVGDVAATEALAAKTPLHNVTVLRQTAKTFSAPEPLDVVFTCQNYHDYSDKFMGSIGQMTLNRAVFRALKPGGYFIIVDHAAAPGHGLRDTDTLHRVDEATVKAQVTAAGFVFDGESRALRNPSDDHRLPVFNPKVRGRTDQFALRFRKPPASH